MTAPADAGPVTSVSVVADDLTGATDSAVQFARAGWATRLALAPDTPASATPEVTSFVTDARALNDTEARAVTATAVAARSTDRVFLKIDSTLRGSVAAQIAGALDAWAAVCDEPVAIVCSAYPAMQRTVENAQLLVGGAPVHTTAIGADPVTPVTTSDLRQLIRGITMVTAAHGETLDDAVRTAIDAGSRIIGVDATADADLSELAPVIANLGRRVIPVGSAGLAVAMSRVWPAPEVARSRDGATAPAERIVIVASSLHETTRAQVQNLAESLPENELSMLSPSLQTALDPAATRNWLDMRVTANDALARVVIIASPAERPAAGSADAEAASVRIAECLATATAAVVESVNPQALILLGGEGARAVLDHLGAESLLIHDAVIEGIPLATAVGGRVDGTTVVTKAGGFGSTTDLTEIVNSLQNTERQGARS